MELRKFCWRGWVWLYKMVSGFFIWVFGWYWVFVFVVIIFYCGFFCIIIL